MNPAVKTSIRANPAFEVLREINEYQELTK